MSLQAKVTMVVMGYRMVNPELLAVEAEQVMLALED
jgi:hypothetical protein